MRNGMSLINHPTRDFLEGNSDLLIPSFPTLVDVGKEANK